jgi:hypothetical protein
MKFGLVKTLDTLLYLKLGDISNIINRDCG